MEGGNFWEMAGVKVVKADVNVLSLQKHLPDLTPQRPMNGFSGDGTGRESHDRSLTENEARGIAPCKDVAKALTD
jgi:hypothetical protein